MDTLKIFFSTLIVIVISTLVYFAIYFLFPEVSDTFFGMSYANGCSLDAYEEKQKLANSVESVSEFVSARTQNVTDSEKAIAEKIPQKAAEVSKETVAFAEDAAEESAAIVDEEVLPALHEKGDEVLAFFESEKGSLLIDNLKKAGDIPADFDFETAAATEEGRRMVNSISDYVSEAGVSLDEMISNSSIMKLLTGKTDDSIDSIKEFFSGWTDR